MIRLIYVCVALISGLADDPGPNAMETSIESSPRGHLVIVGGGPPVREINNRTLELAGGLEARIVIVPFASPDPLAGEKSATVWQELGAIHVAVLDLSDPAAAVALIQSADLIWIRGGEQQRLMEALEGVTGLVEAIRDRYLKGGTIGGTSAGAAVMSRLMIAGPAGRRGTPEWRYPRYRNGLGLWPDVIVDQHFVRRLRHERLELAVLSNPALLGIGIDESTAVVVEGREFEVIGVGPVIVFDARKAAFAPAMQGVNAGIAATVPLSLTGFTLRPGMRFHLDQGLVPAAVATR